MSKTSVEQLYGEIWAEDSSPFDESLNPRGTEWLFEAFAELGPEPGQLVVDIGARDAKHAIRLVQLPRLPLDLQHDFPRTRRRVRR